MAAVPPAMLLTWADLGWWLGHLLELSGIVAVGVQVALDLRRSAQSRPLSGDLLAAELVAEEEAFLGARVRALTMHLAEKDVSTEEHTRRVAMRAVQVGEELGLPPHRLRQLAIGGLLHDIGKLRVPDAILKKPGPLTDHEFAVVKRHPEWGRELLGELGGFADTVRRLVLDHHERLVGGGYPRGIEADELQLDTRILTVCDVYDALISPRVYREAWTHEQAIALLREETGEAFDHRCVAALELVLARERAETWRSPSSRPTSGRPGRTGRQASIPEPAEHRQLRRLLHPVVHGVDQRDAGLVGPLAEGADLLLDEVEPAVRRRVAGHVRVAAALERRLQDLDHRAAARDHGHAPGLASRSRQHVHEDLGAEVRAQRIGQPVNGQAGFRR